MTVCAATNNPGKLKELRRILEKAGHAVKSLRELGITLDPEETGATFAENARIKAAAFCAASGLPSGVVMAALTELELAGLSRQLAGRQFERCG